MMDSNMAVYILVCAVMLLAIVMLFFDDIKTTSALMKANTRITELEKINDELEKMKRDISKEMHLAVGERDDACQTCDRLREENNRLKSIHPVDESLFVPLYGVTLGYDGFNTFTVSATITGINKEHHEEFIDMLMSKRIAIRKAEEVKE